MQNSIFGMGIEGTFFNPNCENSMDQRDLFDSALSSFVSSPVNSNPGIPIPGGGGGGGADSIVLRELIGRLGGICNSGGISPQSCINGTNSVSNSCYNTPLNSPPKLNLSIPIPGNETGTGIGMKGQSTSNSNGRKRKVIHKGKGKETQSRKDDRVVAEAEKEESDAKRSKSNEDKKSNEKSTEPPKDYIHVRARRGQATDSHSLAERVRREKISERMKFLQDLVPGCNKVTGKAVMLDEIINYVQSLQRQVEFLSMKLATVNPRMDVSMEALLSKDMFRPLVSIPNNPFDGSVQPFPYGLQSQINGMNPDGPENQFSTNPLMVAVHRDVIMKPSHIDGFGEGLTFWENDLQSVVKMAIGHDQPQGFHGQMKVEL